MENQIAQRVDSVLVHILENLTAIKVLQEIVAPFFLTLLVPLNNILREGLCFDSFQSYQVSFSS